MELTAGGGIVLRHWRTVAAVALLGALVALLATYILPQKYQASSSLLVHSKDVRLFSSQGQPAASGQYDLGQTDTLVKTIDDTQGAVLTSRPVAERVVQQLHLDQPRPPKDWFAAFKASARKDLTIFLSFVKYGFYKEPSPYEAAVQNVQRSIVAKQVQDSYMLQVQASASEPDDAANIANAAANAFMQYTQEVYGAAAKQHRETVQSEMQRAQTAVTAAQGAVDAYKDQHHLPALPAQMQLDATTADAAQKTLDQNDSALAAAKARLARLQQQLKDTSPTVQQTQDQKGKTSAQTSGGEQTIDQSGTVHNTGGTTVTNQQETVVAQGQGTSKSAPFAPEPAASATALPGQPTGRFGASEGTSQQRTTTDSQNTQRVTTAPSDTINNTSQHIVTNPTSSDQQTSLSQTSTLQNPVYQQLALSLAQTEQDVAALQAQHGLLSDALAKANSNLNRYPTAEGDLAQLQLQLDAATNTYLKLRGDFEDAVITEAQTVNDVSIVDVATPPIYPTRPLKYLFFLIGLAVGAVGGTGVAFWQDYYSRKRRTAPRPAPAPAAPPAGRPLPDMGAGMAFSAGDAGMDPPAGGLLHRLHLDTRRPLGDDGGVA